MMQITLITGTSLRSFHNRTFSLIPTLFGADQA